MRSLTAGLATASAALLSICSLSPAAGGDLAFSVAEAAAIKAYYASRPAQSGPADGALETGRDGAPVGIADESSREATRAGAEASTGASPGRGNGHGKGHGRKGGRDALPPGIAKNLARGKPLPPGIAMQRLPAELTAQLPPPPEGCERIVVDGKVLLVDIATRVVHDILVDAVYR